jgi:hypothetical protein
MLVWRRLPEPRGPRGARPRIPHRPVLTGILFVLRSGIPWELLPQELGYGSGMTCWRRLQQWQAQGLRQRIHHALLNWLLPTGGTRLEPGQPGQRQRASQTGRPAHGSRTRPIGAKPGPSAMWSSTGKASPSAQDKTWPVRGEDVEAG